MTRVQSDAATVYVEACNREHAECALELVQAFENNDREVNLSDRSVQLNDVDLGCIAEALRSTAHSIRVLNLEGNAFGMAGLQALLEAVEKNPGILRELRLGRNKLKDQAAVVIGHALSRDGCGLKVLDLSENDITKLGVIPIAAAIGDDSCDVVELSFHNNKIEADAATYLGQAIRHAGKLRHLHLGYNAIRDAGAAQLAQCIPVTVSLSTLDLTANRIGPSGGKELARALMTNSCNIQRLNLRHNLFDSETIEMYAEVIQTNTSLIQLFLGFMNPTPHSAALVLSALCANRSLLLLDIYGWKLHVEDAWKIIDSIQRKNATIAAIVTDACQSIARRIDEGNDEREDRGQHPIYVGPDDRDAYIATKSLRRFSRAQSRRQSRASSRGAMSSRTGSPSHRRAVERSHSYKDSSVHSPHSTRAHQEISYQSAQSMSVAAKEELQHYRRTASGINDPVTIPSRENIHSQLEYQSGDAMRQTVEQLRRELFEQRQIQRALELRVAALESKLESMCYNNTSCSVDRTRVSRAADGSGNGRGTFNRFNDVYKKNGSRYRSSSHNDAYRFSENTPHSHMAASAGVSHRKESIERSKSAEAISLELRQNGIAATGAAGGGGMVAARSASNGASGGPAEFPHISVSRTERSEPPAEPLELPKERRPAEAMLQTSTRVADNYQPQLAPSPSKDKDPPRRKGSIRSA
ncbi:hypothetical protein MOQ_001396 [Trypanosoma cruzi marinkellei]|uniref:Uncharacterized protein n=1 Tax=Trypanosoma cruzi marinkellei TaxID=85056 RepID=K2NTQ0_TRYCR|nr:hypothetical protein MOQ_001396 [Trypanosoma cruzi marinkellei]